MQTVRLQSAVTDNIEAQLAARAFDAVIGLTFRCLITLGILAMIGPSGRDASACLMISML